MRRAVGIVVLLVGLFLVADGVTVGTGTGWASDIDLDRAGMIEVGLAFAVLGLSLTAIGLVLFGRWR